MTMPALHLLALRSRHRGSRRLAAALCLGCWLGAPVQAQLRLPSVTLPSLPVRAPGLLAPLPDNLQQTAVLGERRLSAVRELLRRHPGTIESDPRGEPIRSAELIWLAPAPAALDAALAEGYVLLRDQAWPELDLRQVVLRPPPGLGTARAADRLRRIDPSADVDFNHLYTRSADMAGSAGPATIGPTATPAPADDRSVRIGLVDSGIDAGHPALNQARTQGWGCGGTAHPSAHGTAVASLLVGRDQGFVGVLPGAALYAADVYCDHPAGGAVEEIAAALAWLARERVPVINIRVPVINISLVGPANRLLERAIQALARRGHLVVAAVGNDGPAAAPLYPAAYPDVIGVTGVTPARRALPEAAQGPQVRLAAPGAALAVARHGGGYVTARGTSFAAPLVAGLLADAAQPLSPDGAAAALARLAARAVDLGAPGRDPVFGLGLVGETARIPPERVQARSP